MQHAVVGADAGGRDGADGGGDEVNVVLVEGLQVRVRHRRALAAEAVVGDQRLAGLGIVDLGSHPGPQRRLESAAHRLQPLLEHDVGRHVEERGGRAAHGVAHGRHGEHRPGQQAELGVGLRRHPDGRALVHVELGHV